MPIFRLHPDKLDFPDPRLAEAEGIIAVGGDLRPERLLTAYAKGIFPWYSDPQPILWWSPDPRFVLVPDELRVSKSMRPYFNRPQ
ncbi:MAG: leucyl/phenylalanyl-tRNA--protein transferase, partial [Saprospiraceae bacterium]